MSSILTDAHLYSFQKFCSPELLKVWSMDHIHRCQSIEMSTKIRNEPLQDFSGCPVVNNPPANAGDTGLIHDLRRFYMLWGN